MASKKSTGKTATNKTTSGRFAYDGLSRTIHEKARLGIMASLAAHPGGVLFTDLKEHCALTDGNLARHLQVLEEAGFVEVWKGHQNRRPQTLYRLTREGREELLAYVAVLERVVADAAVARKPVTERHRGDELGSGWAPA
jgi:DNA-binding MarR family transcriptional regulator